MNETAAQTVRTVRVDGERLWATLMELEEIGAYDDEAAGYAAYGGWR